MDGDSDDEEGGTNIELTSPHPAGARVHMSRDGVLTWPVMLLYPEFDQADYIESFRENDKLSQSSAVYSVCTCTYIHV